MIWPCGGEAKTNRDANHLTTQRLLQLCKFRLGLLQDRDVGIGIFPKGDGFLVVGAGFARFFQKNVCAAQFEASERADLSVDHDSRVGEDFLELRRHGTALPRRQVRFAAPIHRK